MDKRETPLRLVVGEAWPNGVTVVSEGKRTTRLDPRSKVGLIVVLSAVMLLVFFSISATVRFDRALEFKAFSLIEKILLLSVGWVAGGSSELPRGRIESVDE